MFLRARHTHSRNFGNREFEKKRKTFRFLSLIANSSTETGLSEGQSATYNQLVDYFKIFSSDFIAMEWIIVAFEDIPQIAILSTLWKYEKLWNKTYITVSFDALCFLSLLSLILKVIIHPIFNDCLCLLPDLRDVPENIDEEAAIPTEREGLLRDERKEESSDDEMGGAQLNNMPNRPNPKSLGGNTGKETITTQTVSGFDENESSTPEMDDWIGTGPGVDSDDSAGALAEMELGIDN